MDIGGAPLAAFKLMVCLALPGWVLLSRLSSVDRAARLVWTLTASAALYTTLALAMAWTGFWYPRQVAAAVVLAAVGFIVLKPGPYLPGTFVRGAARGGPALTATGGRGLQRRSRIRAVLPWLTLAVAAPLWVFGLATTGHGRLGDFGLLSEFPLAWYIAVGLVVGTCVYAVVARKTFPTLLMSVSVSSLVVVLYSTAGLLAEVPRFPWTYKHIAVTNFITATGNVDPSIDIYNRWPGFFALSAYLGEVMGYRNALDYAAWAETGFALVDAVLVLAIVRTISNRARIYWTATIVFTLANWVNQNYYAPQSYSYSLYLAMCLIALTFLRGVPFKWMAGFEMRIRRSRIVQRVKQRHPVIMPSIWERRGTPRQLLACVAILIIQAVIVVSHQLTPYLAVLGLFPLFMSGYFRPRWMAPALLAIPLAYFIPNLAYVKGKYGLFSGFNLFANTGYRPPRTDPLVVGGWVLTGQSLAHLAVVLTLATGVLAVAGFVRRLLHGHVRTTLVVAWLAFAPALGLLAQSYGGEARFRVFLFALPWLSIGVAWLFWSGPVRTGRTVIGASAGLAAMAMLFTVVHFQPEADYRVPRDDVVASQWLDANTKAGDIVFDTKYFFPLLVGSNYPHYLKWGSVSSLVDYFREADGNISVEGLRAYADHLRGAENNYVIITDEQKLQAVEKKRFEAEYLPELEGMLENGVGVENVFSNDTVRIYKFKSAG
ncbi:hypothetical protein NG701_00115 [Pseudarthrobacter sp. HLT3-5]|uniref:hypothetical protein n=1 Tax=Pseudarthrobacter cellobiosi TaxID=2953654 RepID=UPI00208EBAB0|nr:hypothetical protein [Pseudarthrobacter sp. HLT3-5]MCO4272854.1 hypothetical protein [Pseudarthrobacter sp. HLT3-5]